MKFPWEAGIMATFNNPVQSIKLNASDTEKINPRKTKSIHRNRKSFMLEITNIE